MDRVTSLQQATAPTDNLLVVEDDGEIISRRVSQLYGQSLLGAMASRLNSLPGVALHVSFLAHHEPLDLDAVRATVQKVAPRDNFMFIDDGRKILSCRINPDNGVALLENLEQEQRPETQPALAHSTPTRAGESSNNGPAAGSRYRNFLPDHVLSSANRQPYDREWMIKYGIHESYLDGPPSKHKLDVLLRYGVIKAGDKLCVTYHPDGRDPVVKVGEVLQTPQNRRLDIRIAPARNGFDGILHDCKSPMDIVRGMDREFRMDAHDETSEAWKAINVVSENGREVGSLWKVRQAYEVFAEEMEGWGDRNRRGSP